MGSFQEQSFTPLGEEKIVRQTADFCSSVWGNYFISYSVPPLTVVEPMVRRKTEELKREVKALLRNDNDPSNTLSLIDELERFGIEYHFEEEINESLRGIQNDDKETDDMHIVALRFRLLRQHGFNVSSDVFRKFKDEDGKFKQEISCDAKGLLYLYEASWLGTREEVILDEAMDFARGHMERLMTQKNNNNNNNVIAALIEHALEMPFQRGMRRLEARHYITMYKDEARSQVLLELAKLDFNHLQSLHQAEIKSISTWWREMGHKEKLSFARDRVVECYFWSSGVHFEPQYSQGRLLLAKMIILASIMDDMFDAYGTPEELHLFNDVIQRWDLQDVDQLPDYMVVYLNSFTSLILEIEEELIRKGRLHHKFYLVESVKGLVDAYFVEAKWASKGYMPTLKEYLHISVMSSGYPMLTCASLVLLDEEVTEDVFDWVLSVPKIVEASALIARLMNDLVSTKLEQERNHVSSSVQCYMNDFGVAEQEACIVLGKMVADAWKDLNKEHLKSLPSHKHLNMLALNFSRMIEVIYKHEDGYTNPSGEMKENIALLLVHSIED